MKTSDVIIIIVAFAALGFSLYRKYVIKNQRQTKGGTGPQQGSSFSSRSKDDDYEPYSKK
jgi:uncharacterized membrane protein YebE (DUF533 family)